MTCLTRWAATMLLGIGLVLIISSGTRAGALQECKISVVDISVVFDQHPQTDVLEKDLRRERDVRLAEYNQLLDQIEALKGEQKELDPESSLWNDRQIEIEQLKEESKVRKKNSEKELQEMAMEATNDLLEDIEAMIQSYCRKNGITICHKIDTIPLRGSGMELAFKSVLYYHHPIDITREIIDLLKK